jgi:hypothetical protein
VAAPPEPVELNLASPPASAQGRPPWKTISVVPDGARKSPRRRRRRGLRPEGRLADQSSAWACTSLSTCGSTEGAQARRDEHRLVRGFVSLERTLGRDGIRPQCVRKMLTSPRARGVRLPFIQQFLKKVRAW